MRYFAQRGSRCLYNVGKDRCTGVIIIGNNLMLSLRRGFSTSLTSVRSSYLLMISNSSVFQLRCNGTLAQTLDEVNSSSSSSNITTADTAGNDSNMDNNDGNNNDSQSKEPRELQFYEDFLFDEEDVHYLLLQEAHIKHGVLLNVPPQSSPSGTPPEVPEVILSAAHVERMRGIKLAYEPTHMPPPLYTTGTRQLVIDNPVSMLTTMTKKPASSTTPNITTTTISSSTSTGKGGSATTVLLKRLPPDPTMRFHCSACGKAFRLEFSAEQHVKLKHPSEVRATVVAGPGEGEIIEEAEATVVTSTQSKGKTKTTTTTTAVGESDEEAAKGTSTAMTVKGTTPKMGVSGKTQQTEKEGLSVGISTVKTSYSKATLTLPPEELVDDLLKDIWDNVAANRDDVPKKNHPDAYVPFASVVEGKADRRKEIEANAKPTARATPEGAAPGIKKPGMLPGGALVAPKTRGQGQLLPIKELIKKYPNPFGDSPNAVLQELEKEPVNPFIPQEELVAQLEIARENDSVGNAGIARAVTGNLRHDDRSKKSQDELKARLRASRPSLTRSASLRRFTCPLCVEKLKETCKVDEAGGNGEDNVPSFRLLDALLDHVESTHEGEELTEEQLQALYAIQRKSPLHSAALTLNDGEGGTGNNAGDGNTRSNGNDKGDDSQTPADAVIAASLPELFQNAAPPAAVERKALSVHVRTGNNTVLLGRIADVQHGFLDTMAVTQYVLEVDGDAPTHMEGSVEPEKELIVIRCMGDNFPVALLKEQVKLGSTVLVQGTLRMNRHIDNTSKRLYAYPFVQVVPPLGCVKVLG